MHWLLRANIPDGTLYGAATGAGNSHLWVFLLVVVSDS
jgi:hypothetical protein